MVVGMVGVLECSVYVWGYIFCGSCDVVEICC